MLYEMMERYQQDSEIDTTIVENGNRSRLYEVILQQLEEDILAKTYKSIAKYEKRVFMDIMVYEMLQSVL